MVRNSIIFVLIALTFVSCSSIPSKTIMEPLSTSELATIIKKDTTFENFYQLVSEQVGKLSDIDKAKYSDITYSSMYDYYLFIRDTTWVLNYEKEWDEKYSIYLDKVDSVITYWKNYKEENSLTRFVTIAFDCLDKEYYTYSHDVKTVNFAFKLIPAEDYIIEQVRFNYKFKAKINEYWGDVHWCLSSTPFSKPTVRYWEVTDYSEEKRLKNVLSENFLRDYDIAIEITDVRKDGVNYSLDDLAIPKSVSDYFSWDPNEYPVLSEINKSKVIKELLIDSYQSKSEFVLNQFEKESSKRFPKEFEFIKK